MIYLNKGQKPLNVEDTSETLIIMHLDELNGNILLGTICCLYTVCYQGYL